MVGELLSTFIAVPHTRDEMIEKVERLRREAQRAAEARARRYGFCGAPHAKEEWAAIEQLGHLLFFLRFGKIAPRADASVVRWCIRLGEELATSKRQVGPMHAREEEVTSSPRQRHGSTA
jgi:hypothetical protein